MDDNPTITKRRYWDRYLDIPVFETYTIGEEVLNKKESQKLEEIISANLPDADLILVADYGHGLINDRMTDAVSKRIDHTSYNQMQCWITVLAMPTRGAPTLRGGGNACAWS